METVVDMLNKLKEIYKGKKVFLTGHTGFKGSWLLKILNMLGAEVKGYALPPTEELNIYSIIEGDNICESIIADLRNKEALKKAVSDFQPDFVFHLAAQPLVTLSYQIPSETFEVNAIGTANLLDAVTLLEKPCNIVLITTDKVYQNNEWEYPYRENDKLGGYDPYSASKACAELVIDSYRNSFFNVNNYHVHNQAGAVGRAGNVIGGGDWSKDRLIPDIARAIGNNKKIVIRNPDSVRPWQHVLEPLVGYLLLGGKLVTNPVKFAQPYNFGPYNEDALTVMTMVEFSIARWEKGEYEIQQLLNQPHEARLLKLDVSKAINQLGWKPRLNAKKAIEDTVDWYKAFFEGKSNMDKYTEKQIADFLNIV